MACSVFSEQCFQQIMCLNNQCLVGGIVWGGYGAFRRYSLAGGTASVWAGFEGFSLASCLLSLFPLRV